MKFSTAFSGKYFRTEYWKEAVLIGLNFKFFPKIFSIQENEKNLIKNLLKGLLGVLQSIFASVSCMTRKT